MTSRTKLIAGNWKMNGRRADGLALAGAVAEWARVGKGEEAPDCELLICPPATLLAQVCEVIAGSGIRLGGQDCHCAPNGAFTGDISAEMLADAGCTHVILGHSERRHGHGETDLEIRGKVAAAHRAGLVAILCVGETRPQREAGEAIAVVGAQLAASIPDGLDRDRLIVAYEPVWAIGTGLSATLDDIAAMHAAIRADLTPDSRILYGGSVNPANAAAILALTDVDGALVGGASLDPDAFWAIARCCG
ncbi:MAG: triose-phosphate isomerase [Stellaceae bacterium]